MLTIYIFIICLFFLFVNDAPVKNLQKIVKIITQKKRPSDALRKPSCTSSHRSAVPFPRSVKRDRRGDS